jgi:CrcB protein
MIAAQPAYLVAAGGIVGALLRHAVGQAVDYEAFPLATLTVNVVGSFVLALATSLPLGSDALLFVGTGACGSFTTFSSFSVGVVQLWENGKYALSVGYAAVNLAGALAGIGLAGVVAGML